jgi:periplasmic copper chaperone A
MVFARGADSPMLKRRHLFALPLLLLPRSAFAHSYTLGALAIGHAWAKPSTGAETEAMMPVANSGSAGDALISASTPVADRVEFRVENVKFDKLELAVGRPFPMRPKGTHLQLIGLKKPLVKGDVVPLTLVFEKAGTIDVELHVENSPGE